MRRFALVAVCVLAGCSKSPAPSGPTSPSPAPVTIADASGDWTGTFVYTACSGPRHCETWTGRNDPFSLRLTQSAGSVAGLFYSASLGAVDVAGNVEADGRITLAGAYVAAASKDLVQDIRIDFAELRVDPVAGLSGQFSYTTTIRPFSSEIMRSTFGGRITTSQRRDLATVVSDLSGRWKGRFLVRACVPSGINLCSPFSEGEVEEFGLTLDGSGASVSGELTQVSSRVPMTGRTFGRTIELQGVRPASPGNMELQVSGFSATVDAYGRLTGRFTYRAQSEVRSTTYEMELVQVVKVP